MNEVKSWMGEDLIRNAKIDHRGAPQKSPRPKKEIQICIHPECKKVLGRLTRTKLCREHVHSYLCSCNQCIRKRNL